jgi:CHAD domain-containing protein
MAFPTGPDHGKARKRVRRLTRLLGRVREMDVALQLLESSGEGVPRLALFEARQHLSAGREARRAEMLRELHHVSLKKIDRSLEELIEAAAEQDGGAWQRNLATRLTRRASRLREATAGAGAIYVPARLHAVRLASKKLRYALEIAAEGGLREAARLAAIVRRTQVTLGHLQDRHVLLREVNDAAANIVEHDEAGRRRRWGLLQLAAQLEQAGRELHGQFLSQRDALASAVTAVRQQVVPELLRGRRTQLPAGLKKRPPKPRAKRVGYTTP